MASHLNSSGLSQSGNYKLVDRPDFVERIYALWCFLSRWRLIKLIMLCILAKEELRLGQEALESEEELTHSSAKNIRKC